MSKLHRGALCVLIAAAFSGGAVAAPCGEPVSTASVIVPGAPLTLRAVMAEITNASPQVIRAALETQARRAETDQAGRRPNPVIGVEFENFAGSGALSGFDQSETTVSFAQTLELGNKRRLRRAAASANAVLANAECDVTLRQVQLEAAILFYELEAALQVAEFANESALLAQTLVERNSPARAPMRPPLRRRLKARMRGRICCASNSRRCGENRTLNSPRRLCGPQRRWRPVLGVRPELRLTHCWI